MWLCLPIAKGVIVANAVAGDYCDHGRYVGETQFAAVCPLTFL